MGGRGSGAALVIAERKQTELQGSAGFLFYSFFLLFDLPASQDGATHIQNESVSCWRYTHRHTQSCASPRS